MFYSSNVIIIIIIIQSISKVSVHMGNQNFYYVIAIFM